MTKNELKLYASLKQKKYRTAENLFVAEGLRLVKEGLTSNFVCKKVLSTHSFLETNKDLIAEIENRGLTVDIISNKDFEKISDTKSPQGIAAIFEIALQELTTHSDVIVALENISDPGNLGTILRTSAWFGVDSIILSEECADIFNPKVLRSSMGAVFKVNIFQSRNFINDLNNLNKNNFSIITTDLNGIELNKFEKPSKTVIVFCNEANGPTSQLLDVSDKKLTIPSIGNIESLNVASAAAIVIHSLTSSR